MTKQSPPRYATFALAIPLYRTFAYRLADNQPALPGMRYRLPFGQSNKVGILLCCQDTTEVDVKKLKTTFEALDQEPVFSPHLLELTGWMADYYLQPIGALLFQCLPQYLRSTNGHRETRIKVWQAVRLDDKARASIRQRTPKQNELLQAIEQSPAGLNAMQLKILNPNWHSLIRALESKQAIRWQWSERSITAVNQAPAPSLSQQQLNVINAITAHHNYFAVHLLDGITGSGKTEVYFKLMEMQLALNRQVIYLVPEIGLTSQLLARVQARFGQQFALSHSGLNDSKRYQAWQQFRRGDVGIMLGTRSCLFSQCKQLGLIILDEEHDSSYKQDDGIHYHARDVAIKRAQLLNIPILLGSATLSLESLHNSTREHFYQHHLSERPTACPPPAIQLLDIHQAKLESGCSPQLLLKMSQHLNNNGQILVYLNRRGFAPVVMCYGCGWQAQCLHCDARLTLHQTLHQLHCHHCGYAQTLPGVCPDCYESDIKHYGIGTEQLEQHLQRVFPKIPVLRVDRDSISDTEAFAGRLQILQAGDPCIVVGTQMIAKGHDYPAITLSVVLDADQALFSASYRASEKFIQTIFQVAGRSGRGKQPGQAYVQTRFIDHPLMQSLLKQDYLSIAKTVLDERKLLHFPPYARVIMFRADAFNLPQAMHKLETIRQQFHISTQQNQVQCIGPMPALMPRRIGRYRAQLCLISTNYQRLRSVLHHAMPNIKNITSSHKVKWTVDVDAYDL